MSNSRKNMEKGKREERKEREKKEKKEGRKKRKKNREREKIIQDGYNFLLIGLQ